MVGRGVAGLGKARIYKQAMNYKKTKVNKHFSPP